MPNRYTWPRPSVKRGFTYKIAPFMCRAGGTLIHTLECLLHGRSGTIGESRNDRPTGKYFGIAGKHVGRHRAAGRQPGDEDPTPIDTVIDDRFFDHLPNRKRFALVAPAVLGLKPVKTTIGIVGPLLLGQKQGKTVSVRESRPSGPKIVSSCGLGASVQHDDKCGIVRKRRRSIAEHPQIAGVRSEIEHLAQTRAAVACTSGAAALQRSKKFVPPTAAAAECLSQIDHAGSSLRPRTANCCTAQR